MHHHTTSVLVQDIKQASDKVAQAQSVLKTASKNKDIAIYRERDFITTLRDQLMQVYYECKKIAPDIEPSTLSAFIVDTINSVGKLGLSMLAGGAIGLAASKLQGESNSKNTIITCSTLAALFALWEITDENSAKNKARDFLALVEDVKSDTSQIEKRMEDIANVLCERFKLAIHRLLTTGGITQLASMFSTAIVRDISKSGIRFKSPLDAQGRIAIAVACAVPSSKEDPLYQGSWWRSKPLKTVDSRDKDWIVCDVILGPAVIVSSNNTEYWVPDDKKLDQLMKYPPQIMNDRPLGYHPADEKICALLTNTHKSVDAIHSAAQKAYQKALDDQKALQTKMSLARQQQAVPLSIGIPGRISSSSISAQSTSSGNVLENADAVAPQTQLTNLIAEFLAPLLYVEEENEIKRSEIVTNLTRWEKGYGKRGFGFNGIMSHLHAWDKKGNLNEKALNDQNVLRQFKEGIQYCYQLKGTTKLLDTIRYSIEKPMYSSSDVLVIADSTAQKVILLGGTLQMLRYDMEAGKQLDKFKKAIINIRNLPSSLLSALGRPFLWKLEEINRIAGFNFHPLVAGIADAEPNTSTTITADAVESKTPLSASVPQVQTSDISPLAIITPSLPSISISTSTLQSIIVIDPEREARMKQWEEKIKLAEKAKEKAIQTAHAIAEKKRQDAGWWVGFKYVISFGMWGKIPPSDSSHAPVPSSSSTPCANPN